uniref:Chromosome segregation protein n=1 Tax=Pseudomonas phage Nican01 TaxID=3138540 RepID=A0AAU6W0C3_9CAUD
MKILKAVINNFAAIGHITVELNDKGLVLIQGDNKDDTSQDSNGSGKSTLPDALCWAFYGETAKGQSGDKLVNRTAKKDCSVEIDVVDEDTDDVYRISRHRKHKTYKNMLRLELLQGSSWKDLTGGTDKLTQALVEKVIGCNYEVFKSAIYAGQEAMPDLPGMTDKQLKVLIEESAGIAQLQAASDIANRHVKDRKLIVQDHQAKIDKLQSNVELLDNNIATLGVRSTDWETSQLVHIGTAEANVTALEASFDDSLGDKITKKKAQLTKQASDIRDKIAGSDAERVEERRLADVAGDAGMAEAQALSKAKSTVQLLADAQHRLDHIGETVGTDCKSCGHTIEPGDVAASTSSASAAVLTATDAKQKAAAAANKASADKAAAQSALSAYRASMTDVSALTAELQTLSENSGKLDAALTGWNRQKTGLEAAKAAVQTERDKKNPYTQQIVDARDQIEAIQEKIEQVEEKRVEAAKDLFVAEEAFRVYNPAGVRAHILDTVTPHLNARTSHYLSTLTDGNVAAIWSTVSKTAKGELREKFVIDVESKTGGESFKDLSGGEKRKVRLACAMALQDLVASRANKPIKLFIADEIDTALDAAGLERLMAILDAKSRDKGTVLVVSHSDLRDFIRNSVTVVKQGGKATLEANTIL